MINGKRNKNILRAALLIAALAVVCAVFFFAAAPSPHHGQRTFFTQFVISGGPIVWFILLPLSVVTVALTINYCLKITPAQLLYPDCGAEIIKNLWSNGPEKTAQKLRSKSDLVSKAVFAVVRNRTSDRRELQAQLQMQTVVKDSLTQQGRALYRKIEPLNIIGNVSPMIGLFGTVFGMIKLFNSIVAASGQPRPEQMADGISIALVTTFWGLLVAIPALVAHSIFANRIESIAHQAMVQIEMILVEVKNSFESQPANPDES